MRSIPRTGGPTCPAVGPDSVRPVKRSYPAAGGESTPSPHLAGPRQPYGYRGRLAPEANPARVEIARARHVAESVVEFTICKKIEQAGRPLCGTEITHMSAPRMGLLHTILIADRDRILGSMVARGILTAEVRNDPTHHGSKVTRPYTYYGLPVDGAA